MQTLIIDVREPEEFNNGHVKNAINIPPEQLTGQIPEELKLVPKNTQLILYCVSGSRSNVAMHILKGLGFTNIINGINKQQVESRYL